MDHLDEVPGTVGSDVSYARLAFGNSGDRLEDRAESFPGFSRTAGHDRWAEQRAFFAAGDPGADEVDSSLAHCLFATDGVGKERVAAIDDDVTGLESFGQSIDHGIRAFAGLHHDDGGAWLRQRCGEFGIVGCRNEISFGVLGEQSLGLRVGAVVDRDGVAFAACEVAGQIGAHNCEPYYANVCGCLLSSGHVVHSLTLGHSCGPHVHGWLAQSSSLGHTAQQSCGIRSALR